MDNTMKTNPSTKKPNMKMIGIIVAVVILVAIIVVVISQNKKGTDTTQTNNNTNTEQTNTPGDGTQATSTTEQPVVTNPAIPKDARVDVVGANPITKDNIVITQTGVAASNDVVPMSPTAPQQTAPITKAQLPSSALKFDVSSAGFSPKEATVKAGAPVTLSVTSVDKLTHVFMFDDNSLAAVAIGVGPGETRAITFNAPAKAGEYTFRCDVPGHAGRGETGKIIVK